MKLRIGPTVQIYCSSGLLFAMVPCLHQRNVYIKSKLRVRRVQKSNPCFGAKSPLHSTGLQTTRFHAVLYRADSTNLRDFGATFRHGTVFAPMQCLHQKEAKGMQSQKCNCCYSIKSPLRNTVQQTTRFHAAGYRTYSTNLP